MIRRFDATLYAAAWTATQAYSDAVVGEPKRPDEAAEPEPAPEPAPLEEPARVGTR